MTLAPLLAIVLALGAARAQVSDAGTPTPTPEPPKEAARLVAALEAAQGEAVERVALFSDGVLMDVIRYRGRTTTSRKNLTPNELDLVREVCAPALELSEETVPGTTPLSADSRRWSRLEIGTPKGPRVWTFDDVTQLPVALGRARGALEDLKARFLKKEVEKDELWDPADVAVGDLLRRRSDGFWFRVARDDRFERNLELQEVGGSGFRLFAKRDDVPKIFLPPDAPPGRL